MGAIKLIVLFAIYIIGCLTYDTNKIIKGDGLDG